MKLNALFSASVLSLAMAAAAPVLAEVSVTAFSAGQTATAASVNANFTAVATGVNDNAAAIAALEARIAALEAAAPAATYQERIAGSTYSVNWVYHSFFGQDASGSMTNYIRFLMGGGSSTITLNADLSVSESNGSEAEYEGGSYLAVSGDVNYTNNMQTNSDSWPETPDTTWSVDEATGIVTILWEGVEPDLFQSAEDGSLFVRQTNANDSNDDGQRVVEQSNVYWVRVPSQP